MRSETCKQLTTATLIAILLIGSVCPAEETRTTIIYPNIKRPVQRIYLNIIKGIKQTVPISESLAIKNDTQPAQLEAILQQTKPDKIIALGRTTANKVAQISYRDQMIVAAALFNATEFPGVSLAIDSRILIKEIESLLPFINKVFVIGDPTRSNIHVYPESLNSHPLIVPLYHQDPLINIQQLWRLLNKDASKTDAIILPSHLDKDILYELAELAWEKKIILLSTNLAQLKEGILMVFYPDNTGMGRQIGTFITEQKGQSYESLTQIHTALNLTIAKHLGLEFAPEVLSQFQLQVK